MIFHQAHATLSDALESWRNAPRGGPGAKAASRRVNRAFAAFMDLEASYTYWRGTIDD